MRSSTARGHRIGALASALFGLIFAVMLVRTAWLSDDAYITLRTVDNFVNGYGPTWNIDERVQAFTHPLWMLALSGVYFFTREAFYTTLVVSIATSLGVYWLVARGLRAHNLASLVCLGVVLLSRAFMDYSTSGLENPATHLLLAAFLVVFLDRESPSAPRRFLSLGALAGLATLNRMDAVLLFIPALASVVMQIRRWPDRLQLAVGFLPFVLWELFAITYYGFPLPNTAYAKLNTGLTQSELLGQGLRYFQNSLRLDPITLTTIVAALASALLGGARRERAIALGILLYLTYVLWIGGDFMSGRYFSAAVLASVFLLGRRVSIASLRAGIVALALVAGLISISPKPALITMEPGSTPMDAIDRSGISDERAFYFPTSSITYARPGAIEPHHTFVGVGLALRASQPKVVALGAIGYAGYFAGPLVHIIDYTALADPLLARLPPVRAPDWRIGHFERRLPVNYMESVEANENLLLDQDLAAYYGELRLVTRGPVWSLRRFVAIWELNAGRAEHLLQSYAGL